MRTLLLLPLFLILLLPAHSQDAYRMDTDTLKAFTISMKGAAEVKKTGELPAYFSANLWDADSTGEVFLDEKPVHGARAVGIRSLSGKGSIQLYNWQKFTLKEARTWELSFDYFGEPGVAGSFLANGENVEEVKEPLGETAGQWKTFKHRFSQGQEGKIGLLFQNYSVGEKAVIYLKNLKITDVGDAPKMDAAEGFFLLTNDNRKLPDLKPEAVVDPYYRSLVQELAPLHPKFFLIAENPTAVLHAFGNLNSMGDGKASMTEVEATGRPYARADRIVTEKKAMEWQTHIQSFNKAAIKRGDAIYITAWVRAIRITDGKANGTGRLYASEEKGGNQNNSNLLYAADFPIPMEWTRLHFPMTATRDFGPDDQLKLMFTFGHTGQTIEFGGIAAVDFGAGVKKSEMPHPKLNVDYPGRDAGAAWRKAAEARIEKFRKADLKVLVTDAQGKPLPSAIVKVNMKKHAYLFGSGIPTGMIPGQNVKPWNDDFKRTAGASDSDKKKAQENFLKLFNAACTSVTWTIWYGGDQRISRDDILAGLKWYKENGITCVDTQTVYPSPEFTPADMQKLMNKDQAEEFGKAVKDYIFESAKTFGPYISSMELANEIEGRPQYTDIVGKDAVVDWFKWAKEANPSMLRMINGPYSLGEGVIKTDGRGAQWPTSDGLQYYYDLISWLKQKGAPIDYIGFQNHQGIGAPGPEAVLKSLDQYATLGYPVEVTEFEVTLQNGKDPEQRKYQADYVRDYLTAVFSHPSTLGIILQDFWQPGAWQFEGASCFYNADWSLNPHGQAYMDLVLGKWWTKNEGSVGPAGEYTARGFLGDYEITVTSGNLSKTVKATLPKAGATVNIKMD